MERITVKHLRPLVERINRELGTPAESYTKHESGEYRANIGNYHLDGAYGGWQLCQMVGTGGGTRNVLNTGHVPARELYNAMQAFLAGHNACGVQS